MMIKFLVLSRNNTMPHRAALIGICLGSFIATARGAQSVPVDDFRTWARTHAHPITISDGDTGFTDLSPVAKIIGSARVVAFGEPIHGAHEPLAARNRLIRYLVTQQGFNAVALETALSTSKRLYDYVLGNTTESDSAAATAFSYGFDAYKENHELLRWLRSYNLAHPMSQRAAIYGIDLAGQGFPTAYRSLEAVLTFLDRADMQLGSATRADFADLLPKFRVDRYTLLPQPEKDQISIKVHDLVALLARWRPPLTAATSLNDYEWALRQAVNAEQDDAYLRLAPRGWPGWAPELPQKPGPEPLDSHFRETQRMREVAIADNLRWVLERAGAQGRVIFFAHDNHVKTHELRVLLGARDDSVWDGLQQAGVFARSALGQDFVVIGTYYGTAEGFPAPNHVLPLNPRTMDGLLGSLGSPAYLIDLRELPKVGPLADWFRRPHEVRDSLDGTNLVRPLEAYDAILYIEQLTPSRRP
jgi:erythromycin esterase